MVLDDLTAFKEWWMARREMNTPRETETNFLSRICGVVLYREDEYQVQLFIAQPNTELDPHIHPNVDSYEVFVGGDIAFMCDDVWYEQNNLDDSIRVKPASWHAAKFGAKGGCFISIQRWLNGVQPTSVELDWHDEFKNTSGNGKEMNYGANSVRNTS